MESFLNIQTFAMTCTLLWQNLYLSEKETTAEKIVLFLGGNSMVLGF